MAAPATASMDISALNNMVVSLRPKVRQAKTRTINKLTRLIKKTLARKGSEEQLEKNKLKASRLRREVGLIKTMEIDKVSKFCLSTELKGRKSKASDLEDAALVRLAGNPVIQAVVEPWRSAHADWQELAAFLESKLSGGRRMKKPKPDRARKVVANNSVSSAAEGSRVDARERRVIKQDNTAVNNGDVNSGSSLRSRLAEKSNSRLKLAKVTSTVLKEHNNKPAAAPIDRGELLVRRLDLAAMDCDGESLTLPADDESRSADSAQTKPSAAVGKTRSSRDAFFLSDGVEAKDDGHDTAGNRPKTKQAQDGRQQASKGGKERSQAGAEPNHPSWNASRQKHLQCQIRSFEGTKVTFDEDDDD